MEEEPDPEACAEIDTCKNVFHVLVLLTDEALEEIVTMPNGKCFAKSYTPIT